MNTKMFFLLLRRARKLKEIGCHKTIIRVVMLYMVDVYREFADERENTARVLNQLRGV